MLVLRLTGKASQVFPLLKALAKKQGDMTLGEIIERSKADGREKQKPRLF